jgi:hypothetical protein
MVLSFLQLVFIKLQAFYKETGASAHVQNLLGLLIGAQVFLIKFHKKSYFYG